jgi:bifunctional DNA-binding transcriptional regulator/antitoxin component of YhaV-PrlF toxin-antitoxin module
MEIVKKVDKHGRLVLPRSWVKKYIERDKVVLKIDDDKITRAVQPCQSY